FRQRVAAAEAARQAGDLAGAAAELRPALALWKGEALAGLPGRHAEVQRTNLGKLRLTALATLLTIEIEQGAAGVAAAELTTLVAEHPLDERFRLLLMLALYRSGQQAEALTVYGEGQAPLAEELGIDPGPQLKELYLQILRAGPESPAPASTAFSTASISTVPASTAAVGPDRPADGVRPAPAPGQRPDTTTAPGPDSPPDIPVPPAQPPAGPPTLPGRRGEPPRAPAVQHAPPPPPP